PGGKVLVGGRFHTFNGSSANRYLVRLNADGTIDPGFSSFTGTAEIFSVLVQGDGKIVMSGKFTTVNGIPRKHIARLNSDGSLDSSFDAGTGVATNLTGKVMLQTDGKLMVQGEFTGATAAASRRGLYRLNTDGALDLSFNAGASLSTSFASVTLGPDNRMVLAGNFSFVDGLTRLRVARLETDGAVDPLFDTGSLITGSNPGLNTVLVQQDGKIIVAPSGAQIYRLISAVSLPPAGPAPVLSALTDGVGVRLMWTEATHEEGYLLERSSDGVGNWSAVGTFAGERTRRVYDGGLTPGATYHYRVRAFNRYGDGPFSAPFLAKVRSGTWPGQIDLSLDPVLGGIVEGSGGGAACVTQPDGKLIVAARYRENASASTRTVIARLNPNGSLDRLFDAVSEFSEIRSLLVQPDGKLLVGGSFKVANGTIQRSLARFNVDGTEDPEFSAGVTSAVGSSPVLSIAIQADGGIVIGGYFNRVNQTLRGNVARLNSNGSVDGTFDPGTGANSSVKSVALDSQGRIVVGGDFTQVNGIPAGRIARLLTNGSVDPTFSADPGAGGSVEDLAVLAGDRIIIVGGFTTYNETPRNRIAQLNENGSLDPNFGSPAGSMQIRDLVVQPDGRSIIAGSFTQIGGIARRSIARLTDAGLLDSDFDVEGSVDLTSLRATRNNRILATGDVSFPDGTFQAGPVRFFTAGGPPPPPPPGGVVAAAVNSTKIQVTWADGMGETGYLVERSLTGANNWTLAGQSAADTPSFTDTGLVPGTQYYYRIKAFNVPGISLPSGSTSGYTMTVPLAPTDFLVRSYGDSKAILTWKNEGFASSYVIERRIGSNGEWMVPGTVSLYTNSFIDSGLSAETEYSYRVRALNEGGDSVATTAATATTSALGLVSAGSLDPTFLPGTGFNQTGGLYPAEIRQVLLQADQKLIVCGNFQNFNGVVRNNIARLNPDGSLDLAFDAGNWKCTTAVAAALQPDGKILVAGGFADLAGYSGPNVQRLNPDGSVDSTFNATAVMSAGLYSTFYYGVQSLALQTDGKVLVAGSSLIRLNANGESDSGFNAQVAGNGFRPWIFSIAVKDDGDIFISGIFSAINGVTRRDLARLNSDGNVDTAFDAGFSFSSGNGFSYGYDIALQPDGKILRANPPYSTYGVSRYSSTGTLDTSFVAPFLSYQGTVQSLAIQSDGKILLGGLFTSLSGYRFQNIARLGSDGAVDLTFDAGLGISGTVAAITLQSDG
ncbi:MAG: fibronectin type III domain-containing protein, partial [Luteolibacter sp.]